MNNYRSEKLTPKEVKEFKKWISGFPTKNEAAKAATMGRATMHNIVNIKSCASSTAIKIRDLISVK
jgi:hypothetical protein